MNSEEVLPGDVCCLVCQRRTYGWALEAHYVLWHSEQAADRLVAY